MKQDSLKSGDGTWSCFGGGQYGPAGSASNSPCHCHQKACLRFFLNGKMNLSIFGSLAAARITLPLPPFCRVTTIGQERASSQLSMLIIDINVITVMASLS